MGRHSAGMSPEGGGERQRHVHLPMSSWVQDTMAISLMRDILFPIFQVEVRAQQSHAASLNGVPVHLS